MLDLHRQPGMTILGKEESKGRERNPVGRGDGERQQREFKVLQDEGKILK